MRECDPDAARGMLAVFGSVGARAFDVTTTDRSGRKIGYRPAVLLKELYRTIGATLEVSTELERNVIVRPRGVGVWFLQLDDLDAGGSKQVEPFSILQLVTSPGNHQAWIAIRGDTPERALARQIRVTTAADETASGAARIAGSLNFKEKYAPDFPRIEMAHYSRKLVTSKEQLLRHFPVSASSTGHAAGKMRSPRGWPSYERCLNCAPLRRDGSGPDSSRADFVWCMIAADWGWDTEPTAARLMQLSAKAKENGSQYAIRTAMRASACLKRGPDCK